MLIRNARRWPSNQDAPLTADRLARIPVTDVRVTLDGAAAPIVDGVSLRVESGDYGRLVGDEAASAAA